MNMQHISQTFRFKYWQAKIAEHQMKQLSFDDVDEACPECGEKALTKPVFRNSIPGDYQLEQECKACGAFFG